MTPTFTVSNLNALNDSPLRMTIIMRQLFIAGLVAIGVLGMVYLMLLNRLSTVGYALQEVRADRYEILTSMEVLDIELANEATLYAFRNSRTVQRMIPQEKELFVAMPHAESVAFVAEE